MGDVSGRMGYAEMSALHRATYVAALLYSEMERFGCIASIQGESGVVISQFYTVFPLCLSIR